MAEIKHRYQSTTDGNIIEFKQRINERVRINSKGKAAKKKLDDEILEFVYVESRTKKGGILQMLESTFKDYLKNGNFVKC